MCLSSITFGARKRTSNEDTWEQQNQKTLVSANGWWWTKPADDGEQNYTLDKLQAWTVGVGGKVVSLWTAQRTAPYVTQGSKSFLRLTWTLLHPRTKTISEDVRDFRHGRSKPSLKSPSPRCWSQLHGKCHDISNLIASKRFVFSTKGRPHLIRWKEHRPQAIGGGASLFKRKLFKHIKSQEPDAEEKHDKPEAELQGNCIPFQPRLLVPSRRCGRPWLTQSEYAAGPW